MKGAVMRKTRITPIGANTFALRIDSYEDRVLKGAFTCTMLGEPVEFKSCMDFILSVDNILDDWGGDVRMPVRLADDLFAANFELDIFFRQNHSWQGRIRSINDNLEAAFHSVLELMEVLDIMLGA